MRAMRQVKIWLISHLIYVTQHPKMRGFLVNMEATFFISIIHGLNLSNEKVIPITMCDLI